ncbi:MAG: hypothetical protein ACRDIU_04290 [Actinomycetota bacterium]
MDDKEARLTRALGRAQAALERGESLKGTGFWKAVSLAKQDPGIAAKYGSQIAEIDRRAFEQAVRLRVPAAVGTAALTLGSLAGIVAVLGAGAVGAPVVRTGLFLAGTAAVLVCTHSLTHWAVGRLMGMRFTHYFLGGPKPPRPGVKVDYATYLAASPRQRAIMHASGAVVTKLVPFALFPLALSAQIYPWASYGLLALGAAQIATDAAFSTKNSDWMKFRRELALRIAPREYN